MDTKFLTLRNNICQFLDKISQTGESIEFKWKDKKFKIVPVDKAGKLTRLTKHKCLLCDPDEIVHIDWMKKRSK